MAALATPEQIEATIAELKAKHDRLPAHFTDQRAKLMAQIEALVDQWLDARGR